MAIIGSKRALLSAAAAVALCAQAAPAFGQEAVIAACQALPTETERFDCLADALRRSSGEATAGDVAIAAPAPVAPQASAPAAAAAVEATVDSEPRRGRLPFFGGQREERVSSDAAEVQAFGQAQIETIREAPARTVMSAAVVSSEIVGFKKLQVELDNGQVWRQVQSEPPWDEILYDTPEVVEIRESSFGGYRMRVGGNRSVVVERVR